MSSKNVKLKLVLIQTPFFQIMTGMTMTGMTMTGIIGTTGKHFLIF